MSLAGIWRPMTAETLVEPRHLTAAEAERPGNLRSDSSFRLAQLAWQRLAACGLQLFGPCEIPLLEASIRAHI